jgi:uncharacterized protein
LWHPRLQTLDDARMISIGDAGILLLAGAAAGVVGTAGGITSLISYPALLAVGVPALPANVANIVALVGCWPGAALASRPELAGRARWLARWAPVAAAGGAAGAALLLSTPVGTFRRVVPFLLAAGALALLLQPRLAAWHRRRGRHPRLVMGTGLSAMSIYNGYFGAGSGVMILALLLVTVDDHLPRANALKNMLLGAGVIVSAGALAAFGQVEWSAAVPLGVGMFAGSTVGPIVARRVPPGLLRWLIAVLGIAVAVRLWFDPAS